MNKINIGVLGSAFNPPTLGHASVVKQALQVFDEVWLIPSFAHGFGKKMMDYSFRVQLTAAFTEDLRVLFGTKKVVSMPVEALLAAYKTPVLTYDLFKHLESINTDYYHGNARFKFIIGPDNLENWSKFYKSAEIDVQWGKWVASEDKNVRSTLVRAALLNNEDISSYVTPTVNSMMLDNIRELEKISR